MGDDDVEREPLLPEELDKNIVYPLVHLIKTDVDTYIDSHIPYEQLTSMDMNIRFVELLHNKYKAMQSMALVWCFLLNRVYYLKDNALSTTQVSQTRADLCEIMAIKLLRDWADDLMNMATVLTTTWDVYQGAADVVNSKVNHNEELSKRRRFGNALELAILGRAKRFIKSPPFQKVIDCIWSGKIVYQAQSEHSFLSDTYKRTKIHFYDPRKAPLLDHYRLKVPAVRAVLEYIEFVVLFILYVIALEGNEAARINTAEMCFLIYALGFTLDKVAAMQEHGVEVYSANLWNAFDIAFIAIFTTYASFRIYGLRYCDGWAQNMGIDILALGACLMFPRLAFVTLSDNLMVLSIRSMMYEFISLMFLAAFCFCGFLYALFTLAKSSGAPYSPATIFWWMLDLYFGLDASGFDKASSFHPIFGPPLMVVYACLSNTLLLTVLVSILSYTFNVVSSDAVAEGQYRKTVTTLEGVKADALFSYQPPLNLIAMMFMLPLSYILNRRWFHKVNVFMIRLTSFPILLFIAILERQKLKHKTTTIQETLESILDELMEKMPRQLRRISIFDHWAGSVRDIDLLFELEEEIAEEAEARRIAEELRKEDVQDGSEPAKPETEQGKRSFDSVVFPSSTDVSEQGAEETSHAPLRPTISEPIPQPQRPSIAPLQASDPDHLAPLEVRARRKSSKKDRRPSTNLLIPPDRNLLVPGLTSAIAAPSPLAQLFHPMVFDDDSDDPSPVGSMVNLNADDGTPHPMPSSSSHPLGVGASSRRISISQSKHKRSKTSEAAALMGNVRRRTQSALHPGPHPSGLRRGLLSGLEISATSPFSGSPPAMASSSQRQTPRIHEPETLTEIEREEGIDPDLGGPSTGGGFSRIEEAVMNSRMDQLEERQKRIEHLLEKISAQLGA